MGQDGIDWQVGGKAGLWRYGDIATVRLSYRPVSMQSRRFRCDIDHINQVRGGVSLDLTERWSVSYGAAYSIEGNRSLANQGLVEYLSRCGCWALGVEIKEDRKRGVDAKVVYRVLGLGGEPPRSRPYLLDGT